MSEDHFSFADMLVDEPEPPYNIRHRCFYFSKQLIIFIKQSKTEKLYFTLYNQLLRSGTSIGANVIEGRAGSSKKDWINYYLIALKSSNETKYWLCLLRDTLEERKEEINY